MNKFKIFIIGVFLGSMLVGGVSFAADRIQIEVDFPNISFWLDDSKVRLDKTILYNGTSYVPMRAFAEALGKEVTWDAVNRRVNLSSVERVPFETVDVTKCPIDIQDWVNRSKNKGMGQVMTVHDETYILVTGGEKETGGYETLIREVKKYPARMSVIVEQNDPPKGSFVSEALTYPLHLIKLKGNVPNAVQFVETDEHSKIATLVGIDYLPVIRKESDNIVVFPAHIQDQQLKIHGLVRSFEGLLTYKLIDKWGQVLETGSIQALSSAPNWGYFTNVFAYDSLQREMSVIFHLVSSEDGVAEEMLTVKLDSLLP